MSKSTVSAAGKRLSSKRKMQGDLKVIVFNHPIEVGYQEYVDILFLKLMELFVNKYADFDPDGMLMYYRRAIKAISTFHDKDSNNITRSWISRPPTMH